MEPGDAHDLVERLYIEHHPLIRDYLFRMSRNTHLADDLTSETFERAMRSLSRPDVEAHANPVAWLRTIAKNLLTDHYRKAASRREIPSEARLEDVTDLLDAGEEGESEFLRDAHALLAALSPSQRTVMVLRSIHGFDTNETAALMERTPQAVRSLRHKAMRRLTEIRDVAEKTA